MYCQFDLSFSTQKDQTNLSILLNSFLFRLKGYILYVVKYNLIYKALQLVPIVEPKDCQKTVRPAAKEAQKEMLFRVHRCPCSEWT